MLDDFLKFIDQRNLCQAGDRILAATSGGIDSMVMLDLFVNAGYDVGIAHCNFQLRGSDSDADERLVKKSAERLAAPYYVKCFNTRRYSREHGISIQMAARKLRYVWLEEIRRHHGYNFISTGHHLNDSIETLFFNLIRSTGLRWLTGIPVKQGNVIRPLLFATKDQIVSYAEDKK
jgi:tRNA(Ile)-lysidine synthase